jgi:predicted signal transduction protein with EAL and GGDEF domain
MIEDVATTASPSTVARKLIDALSAPFQLAERELFVSASVGIALFPQDADDLETLIKRADIAMYAAKEQGRGSFHFFTLELQRMASDRLALEHQLRAAIDGGELGLQFQPQVRAADGALVALEALLRWGEAIAPARFVPVLEESGLITRVTGAVLEEACDALKALESRGFGGLRMAVNLSARQLRQPDLLALIASTLTSVGLGPEQLEIEITESTLLDDEQCQENAAQLGAYGVRLAIDDFGTGYSSLTYLKRFDVDALKIDRSFVQDMLDDQDDAQIVQAVLGLASGLGIESIAEGVEADRQRAQLQAMGCDLLQGYLIARPMPLPDLLRWLAEPSAPGRSSGDEASARPAQPSSPS